VVQLGAGISAGTEALPLSHLRCRGEDTDLLGDARDDRLTCSGMLVVLSYLRQAEVSA